MATAEHREPCESRGSCTVLGAPGGEIPPGDSPKARMPPAVPPRRKCLRKRTKSLQREDRVASAKSCRARAFPTLNGTYRVYIIHSRNGRGRAPLLAAG